MSPPSPEPRCPLCRKRATPGFAPFCSAGCKDRDLLQWLGDGYALPGDPADMALDNDEGSA